MALAILESALSYPMLRGAEPLEEVVISRKREATLSQSDDTIRVSISHCPGSIVHQKYGSTTKE